MNSGMILSSLIMIWFFLPVLTGQVVNIGNITGFSCGFLLFSVFRNPSLLHQPLIIFLICFLLLCLTAACVLTYGIIRTIRNRAEGDETLIILGCEVMKDRPSLMLTERLQAAEKWLKAHPDTKVICSGGQGKNEAVSEAEAMKRWLVSHGIEESRIYEENRSVNTDENIRFSLRIIEEKKLNPSIAVCSNEFHLYRASLMLKQYGRSCTTVSASTAWWLLPTFHVRELYALLWFFVRQKR